MESDSSKISPIYWRALFLAYVAATVIHIAFVVAHEPFAFDAWNLARDTHAEPATLSRYLAYATGQYAHSNPRLGQWFAYPAYKLVGFAELATPLAYLALAWAIATLGLGRLPSLKRSRDLALGALAIGYLWFALPNLPMLMFCRAYATNYLYAAAIQLWFLVPLRLGSTRERGPLACVGYGIAGVLAGLCNEHTGPAILLVFAVVIARGYVAKARSRFVECGGVGFLVGFLAIFCSPGQNERYDNLATKLGFIGRLLQRGLGGNLDIYRDYVIALAPLLVLVVSALAITARGDREEARAARVRTALRWLGVALVVGSVITMTVFVSPKLGPRFYLHACALALAGFIGLADAALTTPRRVVPFVVVAVLASGYAALRTVPLYVRLADNSAERQAALAASVPGTQLTVQSFDQVARSWWALGDDFRDITKRDMIAKYFDLRGVIFRAEDLEVALGVSDVRLVPRITMAPAQCIESPSFYLDELRGLDLGSIHRAVELAIAKMAERLAPQGTLRSVDVDVTWIGDPPAGLPPGHVVVGTWSAGTYTGFEGSITRPGAGKTRRVNVPKALRAQPPRDVFIYHVGSVSRRLGTTASVALDYVPWKRGVYWALACDAKDCFVFAATRLL